eukprot:1159173-Pelagomonas_calceolata.AAC.4
MHGEDEQGLLDFEQAKHFQFHFHLHATASRVGSNNIGAPSMQGAVQNIWYCGQDLMLNPASDVMPYFFCSCEFAQIGCLRRVELLAFSKAAPNSKSLYIAHAAKSKIIAANNASSRFKTLRDQKQ